MMNDGMFPDAGPDDLCLIFGDYKPGEMPLKRAAIKTEGREEELEASLVELSGGIQLSVQSERCSDEAQIFCPLEQRKEELEDYRARGCVLRRNGNSNSNLFTVTTTGGSTVWVRNEGERSLRFQTPDGMIYRVCAGCTEALTPSNTSAQIGPIQVLLDLGGNPLDFQVSAVHVKYGEAPWCRGGLDCLAPGTRVDGYICPLFCGDDCLGVLESYSEYFLEQPRLDLLDIDGYGSNWLVRNKGKAPLPLTWPDGRRADVPADGQVYRIEKLNTYTEEADA